MADRHDGSAVPGSPEDAGARCGWSELAAGSGSVASVSAVVTASPAALSGPELVDAIVASEKALSLLVAVQMQLLTEFARPGRAGDVSGLVESLIDKGGAAHRPDGSIDVDVVDTIVRDRARSLAAAEVAAALQISPITAGIRIRKAADLCVQLPGTVQALAAGRIDRGRAFLIAERTAVLTPELRAEVEEQILPLAPARSTGNLRPLLDRAVIAADPGAAEERERKAQRERELTLLPLPDGMASLKAFAPAGAAVSIFTLADLLAGRTGVDDERPVGARRVDAWADIAEQLLTHGQVDLTGLLNELDSLDESACHPTNVDPPDTPDKQPVDRNLFAQNPSHQRPADVDSAPASPPDSHSADCRPADGAVPTWPAAGEADCRPADGAVATRPAGGAVATWPADKKADHRPAERDAETCCADWEVDAGAAIEDSVQPRSAGGDNEGGDLDAGAEAATAVADAQSDVGEILAGETGAQVHPVGPHTAAAGSPGVAGEGATVGRSAGGASRQPMSGWRARQGRRAHLAITMSLSTWAGMDSLPAHLDGYGAVTAQTGLLLAQSAASITAVALDPESGAVIDVGARVYRPRQAVRDAATTTAERCRFPSCRQPSWRCDLDHRDAFDHQHPENGGATTRTNLDPLCRAHHLLKHHCGWSSTATERHAREWVSPTGHRYVDPARSLTLPGELLIPTSCPPPRSRVNVPGTGDMADLDVEHARPDPEGDGECPGRPDWREAEFGGDFPDTVNLKVRNAIARRRIQRLREKPMTRGNLIRLPEEAGPADSTGGLDAHSPSRRLDELRSNPLRAHRTASTTDDPDESPPF